MDVLTSLRVVDVIMLPGRSSSRGWSGFEVTLAFPITATKSPLFSSSSSSAGLTGAWEESQATAPAGLIKMLSHLQDLSGDNR